MFRRDEAVRPPQPTGPVASPSVPEVSAVRVDASRPPARDMVNIGKSIVIKGELSGSEDLTIEGQVEGKIELRQNTLTIGPNAKIKAEILAKTAVIQGEVHGKITATDKIDIRDAGIVDGDLSAPRVAIADGAQFRGSIDMQRPGAAGAASAAGATSGADTKSATPAASVGTASPGSAVPASSATGR